MQSSPRAFRITPRAYKDLIGIGRYTENQWSVIQRNKYLKELDDCFHWLCSNSFSGKHRPEIRDGYYSFQQGSHIIFYMISTEYIDVIGIPHKSMDIFNYF